MNTSRIHINHCEIVQDDRPLIEFLIAAIRSNERMNSISEWAFARILSMGQPGENEHVQNRGQTDR